jgi:DNA-directed RNA polymerase subunit beta'
VVGPYLRLDQCGLPKEMALELFKPFVMKRLVQKGFTQNIKTARRMVERLKPEVWDALEEVIKEHPVLLNRAPTLHRLGIQAFEPTLVDGKAIQIHPLVCPSFNADFDGDQMAVHVPLFPSAQAEARVLMMSVNNLFSPRDGAPAMAPAYDMVLGCHYLTLQKKNAKAPDKVTDEDIVEIKRAGRYYSSADEAIFAHHTGNLDLHELIVVRHWAGKKLREEADRGDLVTTVGRLIFNEIVPAELGYTNIAVLKKTIVNLIVQCYEKIGNERTVKFLDDVKSLGFRYGTKSGISISMADVNVKSERTEIIEKTENQVRRVNTIYNEDPLAMTAQERERRVLNAWIGASKEVGDSVMRAMDNSNPFRMMASSGARGSERQIQQIVGMRGLMMDPSGRFIEDLPVRSNFREGLNLHEYFVSTHGARKGLADTALRTADAGYLTRRLVDVSQDVIIRADDCGTGDGIPVAEVWEETEMHYAQQARSFIGRRLAETIKDASTGEELFSDGSYITSDVADRLRELGQQRVHIRTPLQSLADRLVGRISQETVTHPETGEVMVREGESIDRYMAEDIEHAGVPSVKIRSILTCKLGKGVCAQCYGHDLATNQLVEIGEAVGIIAAQSIGEPGTQLTMRTFHLGGVAGGSSLTGVANVKKARQQALQELRSDIDKGTFTLQGSATEQKREIQRYLKVLEATVGGLLRVVELFEARKPKGEAITTDVEGTVVAILGGGRAEIMPGVDLKIDLSTARTGVRRVLIQTTEEIADRDKLIGHYLAHDIVGAKGAKPIATAGQELTDRLLDQIEKAGHLRVTVRREFAVPYRGTLAVKVGDQVTTGDMLTRGPLWPQDVLAWRGVKGVAEYLVQEVQKVYKSQSISIHDKHIEVIVRQMLRKRRIRDTGDTELMPGKLVDASTLESVNERATEDGLHPATADYVLLGITEAALATESFLSAASFQKTTKVLTEAATHGRVDTLEGLKENVIIGRLIPAGTGLRRKEKVDVILDEDALQYAQAHADELNVNNIMARTPSKSSDKMPSYDDIYPVPAAIEDTSDLGEAGFSVTEGDPDAEDTSALEDFLSSGDIGLDGDALGDLDGGFEEPI